MRDVWTVYCASQWIAGELDVCLSVHRCTCVEKKNQLDATEWFFELIICSTCFGNFYVHHQELETICVLLPPMVCDKGYCASNIPHTGRIAGCSAPDQQPATKASHTIGDNNTHIVSSSYL